MLLGTYRTAPRPATARRLVLNVAVFAVLGAALAACGGESGAHVDTLTVGAVWARSTAPGARTAALYLAITSPEDDALVGAEVDRSVATAVEIHETTRSGGAAMGPMPGMDHSAQEGGEAMTMTPRSSVALAAQRTVAFEPGGRHLMLTGLVDPLQRGSSFRVTLRFAQHDPMVVDVAVRDSAPER